MGNITVFLDNTGRPIGSCAQGHESDWINGTKGDSKHADLVASQVSSTDDAWHAWARRNAQAGTCLPW